MKLLCKHDVVSLEDVTDHDLLLDLLPVVEMIDGTGQQNRVQVSEELSVPLTATQAAHSIPLIPLL